MRPIALLSLFALLVLTSSVKANNSEAERPVGSISGSVMDQGSKEPVAFATVALYKNNDTINVVKGVVTNDEGKYFLNDVPIGKYDIKISFVGYNVVVIRDVKLDRSNNEMDLGKTMMSESVAAIAEVEIIQERLKGDEQIDKTVYTINDQVRKSSSSGLDMLKHVPAVSVDFQENVTLEGSSNILFYVDGVERNKDYVAQLDPSLIDKVEIITSPGVKYSAEVSGVINIVLVKEPRHGVSGSIKMDVPHPEIILLSPRANIEYGNNNFRAYVGTRGHVEKFNGFTKSNKYLTENDEITYSYTVDGEGKNLWGNMNANYGFDWFINDKTSLNFYGELSQYKSKVEDFTYDERTYIGESLLHRKRTNDANDGGKSVFSSLYLKRKLDDKGSEITMEGNFYAFNGLRDSRMSYFGYDSLDNIIDVPLSNIYEEIDNNRNNTELKIDLSKVYDKFKHEVGYRGYYQWMNNSKTLDMESLQTEDFTFEEIRNVGYYSLTASMGKITLQGGLRYENSVFMQEDVDNISYDFLLPQFNASYKINQGQNLKLTYRKQVYRPGISDLNPFEVFLDSTAIRRGNPNLKPAVDNKIELTYSINFKNNYLAPKAYYIYTNNGIAENPTVENGISVLQQDNILDRYEYGLSLSGAVQLHKRWRINLYGAGFNRVIEDDGVRLEKLSYRTNITNIIMLPKDFVVFAMLQYNSPRMEYQRLIKRDPLYMVGVEKNISKRAKVSAFYNPFIKDFTYHHVVKEYENMYDEWAGTLDIQNVFAIEFTYNFNHGKKINKINRSTEYDQDGGSGAF